MLDGKYFFLSGAKKLLLRLFLLGKFLSQTYAIMYVIKRRLKLGEKRTFSLHFRTLLMYIPSAVPCFKFNFFKLLHMYDVIKVALNIYFKQYNLQNFNNKKNWGLNNTVHMFHMFLQKSEFSIINLYDLNREKVFLLFFFSNTNFFQHTYLSIRIYINICV